MLFENSKIQFKKKIKVKKYLKLFSIFSYLFIFIIQSNNLYSEKRTINFPQSLDNVLDKSLDYKIAKQELKVARRKKNEALRTLFPTISIKLIEETQGKITDDYIRKSYGVEISQPLFKGGQLRYAYKQSCSEYKACLEKIKKIEFDETYYISELFYNCLKLKKIISDYHRIIIELKEKIKPLESQYDRKIISRLDYRETKDECDELIFEKERLQGDFDLALIELKHKLGISYNEKINIEGDFKFENKKYDINEIVYSMFMSNPEIMSEQEKLTASDYGIKSSKGVFLPSLDFEGYYNKSDEEPIRRDLSYEKDWYAGLTFSVPLWGSSISGEWSKNQSPGTDNTDNTESKNKKTYNVKLNILDRLGDYTKEAEAVLSYNNQEKALDDIKKQYLLDVNKSYVDYKNSILEFQRAEKRMDMREDKSKLMEYRVSVEKSSFLEMVEEYGKLLSSVKEYWESYYIYHMTKKKLDILSGK